MVLFPTFTPASVETCWRGEIGIASLLLAFSRQITDRYLLTNLGGDPLKTILNSSPIPSVPRPMVTPYGSIKPR
jgi:hypothetical protein